MKRFNMSVAKIKNAKGEYESIPALRDRSGYETAKANGYTGTEEQWMNDIYSDGWITTCQELEKNKADKTVVEQNTKDIKKLQEDINTWNLDTNIGKIWCGSSVNSEVSSSRLTSSSNHGLQKKGVAIPMINNGTLRIKGKAEIKSSNGAYSITCDYNNTFCKIYLNENVVYEFYAPEDGKISTTFKSDILTDIEVKKGDVLSIILSSYTTETSTSSNISVVVSVDSIGLYANIETPFKYTDLGDAYLENPSTTEILNSLLENA